MPISTNLHIMLIALSLLLIVLHLSLVRPGKIGKIGWKRVDYIWLAFAGLALVGAVGQSRQTTSEWMIPNLEESVESKYDLLMMSLETQAKPSGGVCRSFKKSEYSPPDLARTQRIYDNACSWFQSVSNEYSLAAQSDALTSRVLPLPPWHGETDRSLDECFEEVRQRYAAFVQARKDLAAEQALSKRTENEELMIILYPYFLVIALAIRVTKVSGEVKLEHIGHRPK